MSRIVLLGLSEGDVDVLTRIPQIEPRPEVLVAHPDPTALVLQLASLSEFPTTTTRPSPRRDDVVVIPAEGGNRFEDWIEAFKAAGATLVTPETLAAADAIENDDDDLDTAEMEVETRDRAAGNGAGLQKEETSDDESEPETRGLDARTPKSAPVDIWSDPETTFRFLMKESLGRSQATLWWDGSIGVWVPWLRTGSEAMSNEKSVMELSSSFGAFRLTGNWVDYDAVPVSAVTRVAEDIALRDLAAWQRTEAGLPETPKPGDEPGLQRWGEALLEVLSPESAWIWEQTPEGWTLRLARGTGVAFSGTLTVPESLMESFPAADETLHWEHWQPRSGIHVRLGMSKEDARWPLRWERVKQALSKQG